MDRPLLALTRQDDASHAKADPAATMSQLIQLRWLAVGGQLLTILVVRLGLGVPLPLAPMLAVVGALALANILGMLLPRTRVSNFEIMLALLLDIGSLTAQLYLSGGATNPFISFYLLQVVLGAILLEGWSAWVLIGVAALSFAGLTQRSLPLAYPPSLIPDIGGLYTLGAWISFALTAMLLGLFVTRITRNLRARDRYLADLRQHAAEEDGIVRMGLFASGAAHELGTPLATLSVILSDWRHIPRIAQDAELVGELEEMRSEVERCKAIVGDILHSAGEPRDEAMESRPARAFLNEVIADWCPTHIHARLEHDCHDLKGGTLVTGASLRQAIWNLLDNAAEVSPGQILVRTERFGEEIRLSVVDRGPGFAPAQLAALGKPYLSSKGAGHGVGLFLAATVARRLGGRLEAANVSAGGAEVSLVLPLAHVRGGERP